MDIARAKAIINSSDNVEVLYQGAPVWLNDIENDMASVTYLENNNSLVVPVEQLMEKKIVG